MESDGCFSDVVTGLGLQALLYEVLGQLVGIDHPVLLAIPKKLAREGVLRMAVDSKLIWLQHRADHQPALVQPADYHFIAVEKEGGKG